MTDPVDLTNIREITGGEKNIETQLFEAFIQGSDDNISALEANCTDGENEVWRKEAHSLKGAAKNIGAGSLADICAKAQESSNASGSHKQELLDTIKKEYEAVTTYLNGL